VSEKNSRATANQKRNNEGHERYSCKTIRIWRRFVSGLLRWGAEVVSSPWSFCGSGWRAIAGGWGGRRYPQQQGPPASRWAARWRLFLIERDADPTRLSPDNATMMIAVLCIDNQVE
jgi:hypothetical protein